MNIKYLRAVLALILDHIAF